MPGMAFSVISSVRGDRDQMLPLVAELRALSFDSMSELPGFRTGRLYTAEDGTEAMVIVEWDSREDFLAYRQTELGQRLVAWALQHHPHIAFYDVTAAIESPGR
jgi:heme-degrading monooxygenase HmoA